MVSDRLSAIDASFLYLDCDATPMHTGSVLRFAAPGIAYQDLIAAVSQHIGQSPRYRRRVREVPLHLGRPVWVDDERFDVEFHVRAATLPRPGERAQLDELVARLLSRRLDVDHPLWEMYVVDGLADGGVAVITKTHQAMVDGSGALPIEQALLSSAPGTLVQRSDAWEPQAEPGAISLVAQAVSDSITGPAGAVDAARSLVADVGSVAKAVGGRVLSVATAAVHVGSAAESSPLNVPIGPQRRYMTADYPLNALKQVRSAFDVTVNDVALAVIAGGLRSWLMLRGRPMVGAAQLRAMVPMSTRTLNPDTGSNLSAFLINLPVGEPDPIIRLRRIAFELGQLKDVAQLVGAQSLVSLAGFAPPSLHALSARLTARLTKRVYNLVITNAPGPQVPLFLGQAQLLASYPFVTLTPNQALAVGFTSYNGMIHMALTADREAMPDLDDLMSCLADSLQELHDAAEGYPGSVSP